MTLLYRALALMPLYLLGKSLVGGARAFWAILILIMLPYPAQFGSDVLRDWPYVMFLSLGFWLLYAALQRRIWWMFALAGLDAAAGYLIQPASAQLVLYGLLGLAVVLRRDAKSCVSTEEGRASLRGPLVSGALLIVGFAGPVLPVVWATGTLVPQQLNPATFNSAPVITSVGGRGASRDPPEFDVREGDLLEIGIEASDPQGDNLMLSLAAIPAGSRPVYQFRLTAGGDYFTTISEDEKNTLLEMYPPAAREYQGIVYYAYTQADARPGLEPVHRFWSPFQQQHFYTIRQSEKDALVTELPRDAWAYEGIAFYAFAQGHQPPDTVPVHRLGGKLAHLGTVPSIADDEVVWYVHVVGKPPAGMSIQEGALRWRPGPGQRGEYWINIIVSDGKLETCQLVRVTVREGPAAQGLPMSIRPDRAGGVASVTNGSSGVNRDHPGGSGKAEGFADGGWANHRQAALAAATHHGHACASLSMAPVLGAAQYVGLGRLPAAVDRFFDGFTESLMVFFLVPWGVGLYWRMRHEAGRLERVLMTAVIVVNVGLILSRYLWVSPTVERRYCLPMLALTIFYVPVGLEQIAHWLSRRVVSGDRPAGQLDRRSAIWFHVLAVIGIGVCLPKLLAPLYADKDSYVKAIEWLHDNTRADDVTAVPDSRLTFYAERPGLVYRNEVDPRRADYIVRILEKGANTSVPGGWSQEYSVPTHDRHGRTLTIYKTHRRKG
jgi:hypothetical protein